MPAKSGDGRRASGKKAKRRAAQSDGTGATAKDARRVYEQLRFSAPGGTRAFYREAASLEQMQLEAFMREAIHAYAKQVFQKHGKPCDPPPVHPERPPPLSPNR